MSESIPRYNVSAGPRLRPATLLRQDEPGFDPPTYEDVQALSAASGLTGGTLANLAGLSNARSFRRWTAPPGAKNSTPIPYAAWRILLIETGLLPADQAGAHPRIQELKEGNQGPGRPKATHGQ